MKIIVAKSDTYAYPKIGKYITPKAVKLPFSAFEIKDHLFKPGIRILKSGVRQSQAESTILGNLRMIDQKLVPNTFDIYTSAWR